MFHLLIYRVNIFNFKIFNSLENEAPFENYIKTCIGYFKIKDEMDILQEEYKMDSILDEVTKAKLDMDDIVTPEEANKLMMRSIKINKLPLDGFVKVKHIKPEKEISLPKQKEINLKGLEIS